MFNNAEQAFAYAKTFFAKGDSSSVQLDILDAKSPGEAKRLGRRASIDSVEWDKYKVNYMREIVHAKFSTGEGNLVGQLLNTGACMLVEGNDWGDTFWGRCEKEGRYVGLNTLGVILMEERGHWLHSNFKEL